MDNITLYVIGICLFIYSVLYARKQLKNKEQRQDNAVGICPNLGNDTEKKVLEDLWKVRQRRFQEIVLLNRFEQNFFFLQFCRDYTINKIDLLILLQLMAEYKRTLSDVEEILCSIFEKLKKYTVISHKERKDIFYRYSQYQTASEMNLLTELFIENEEHHLVRI